MTTPDGRTASAEPARNEAAERLRLGQQVAADSHLPRDLRAQADAIAVKDGMALLKCPKCGTLFDVAVAAERSATVERIRTNVQRLLAQPTVMEWESFWAILDEEAAR